MPKKEASSENAFKNWISAEVVADIAAHVSHHDKNFSVTEFKALAKKLEPLELKARIQLLREGLYQGLNKDFKKALSILLKATLKPADGVFPLRGFALWPFTDFIQTYGLKHTDESLKALYQLTPLFTAEFAVRPFLNTHPKATYLFLQKCAADKNEHIRRWASEGSRPRLPWGEQLKGAVANPESGLKILEALKYDDAEYVRKSVANHLNDISKDHPELALKTATRWLKESPAKQKDKIRWIVRHGMRTLLKKGDARALKLLGFEGKVQMKSFKVNRKVVGIGESFEFEFQLSAERDTKAMVDYVLHHQKANGKTTPKVFKLTVKELKAGKILFVRKKHSFRLVTTRAYHPGLHSIEIMVNGHRLGKIDFKLV